MESKLEKHAMKHKLIDAHAAALNAPQVLREQAPVYYRLPKGGELIDVIGHLPFSRASAIKYIYRAGKKDGATPSVVDLRKARRCLDLEIERMERMGEQG